MHLSPIPLCGLLLILNVQLFSTYPVSTSLTDIDMDILKVSLKINDSETWVWKVGVLGLHENFRKSEAVKKEKQFHVIYSS